LSLRRARAVDGRRDESLGPVRRSVGDGMNDGVLGRGDAYVTFAAAQLSGIGVL
jgi:hypothetical protein